MIKEMDYVSIDNVSIIQLQTLGTNDKIIVSCANSTLHTLYGAHSAGKCTTIITLALPRPKNEDFRHGTVLQDSLA